MLPATCRVLALRHALVIPMLLAMTAMAAGFVRGAITHTGVPDLNAVQLFPPTKN